MTRNAFRGPLAALVALVVLGPAQDASATTFCVPSFHPVCPSGGGNVAQASLQAAMLSQGDDGVADRIIIAAGTVSDVDSLTLDSGDADPLEIQGVGAAATAVTTTASSNSFVMNLSANRPVTVKDLTIRIPASFPDNQGSALQSTNGTFLNVDIESRNPGSYGAFSMVGDNTYTGGRVYGSMGGSVYIAFSGNDAESGALEIVGTTIEGPYHGIVSDDPGIAVFARRVKIVDPVLEGVRVYEGGFGVFENGVIETSGEAIPIVVNASDPSTVIATVRHATIVGSATEPGTPAVHGMVNSTPGDGSANLVVSDSILTGYLVPIRCEAPSAANIGNVSLTVRHSYRRDSATVNGDCTYTSQSTNIDAVDPVQFAGPGDYRLPAGSPAIDSGDPLVASLPTEDFDGLPRPVDGDGDGAARRDMGAFEYQPPGPGQPPPTGPPAGGAPGGGAPLPGFGADTGVTLRLASRRVARNRLLKIRIENTNAFAVSARVRLGKRGRALRVEAQSQKTVALRLPTALRKRLLKRGRLRLRLAAEVEAPSGETRALGVRVTALRAPRRH
jgi:hypothetical protein